METFEGPADTSWDSAAETETVDFFSIPLPAPSQEPRRPPQRLSNSLFPEVGRFERYDGDVDPAEAEPIGQAAPHPTGGSHDRSTVSGDFFASEYRIPRRVAVHMESPRKIVIPTARQLLLTALVLAVAAGGLAALFIIASSARL